jgi:ABC-type transport system involved in multi-copper enzyme maturation permease subunit
VKFLGYGLTILILIVISMLIMLCTMFFGKFDPITNPLGMDFSQLRSMETGLLLGCLVICLFFGGVAILISVIAPKVIIMISTIGLAILFNLVYMLAPILSVTSSDYLSDKYSVGLGSVSYMGIDGEMHDSVFANHVRFFTDDHDDSDNNLNTYYYVNEGNKHATGALVAYGNVGQQLSGLFHTFDKSNDGASASSYGSTLDERYWLTENKPVYENPETNSRP